MKVMMKWSVGRQMWMGKAQARHEQSSVLRHLWAWMQPVSTTPAMVRRPPTSRVWQSARPR